MVSFDLMKCYYYLAFLMNYGFTCVTGLHDLRVGLGLIVGDIF